MVNFLGLIFYFSGMIRYCSGLEDWDLVPTDNFNANIRCFNVDSSSIIATIKPIEQKKPSTLKKTISMLKYLFRFTKK